MIPQILPEKASIETSTTCNHTCQYCPVSEFPVAHQLMDLPLFRHVLDELAGLGKTLKRISFNHYNEPLVDPYLVERVRLSLGYGFFRKILLNAVAVFRTEPYPAGSGGRVDGPAAARHGIPGPPWILL